MLQAEGTEFLRQLRAQKRVDARRDTVVDRPEGAEYSALGADARRSTIRMPPPGVAYDGLAKGATQPDYDSPGPQADVANYEMVDSPPSAGTTGAAPTLVYSSFDPEPAPEYQTPADAAEAVVYSTPARPRKVTLTTRPVASDAAVEDPARGTAAYVNTANYVNAATVTDELLYADPLEDDGVDVPTRRSMALQLGAELDAARQDEARGEC